MFSRSKRFDEKPVGCGADAAYNPKELGKPVGGVIPKVERFCDPQSASKYSASLKSDTDSIYSEKSAPVFRTPKAIRRLPVNSSGKKICCNDEALMKELLEAKNVEIRNKNETIIEYETQIKEMEDKINTLQIKLCNHSEDCITNNVEYPDSTTEKSNNFEEEILKLESKISEINAINIKKNNEILAMGNLLDENKISLQEYKDLLDEKSSQINELRVNLSFIKGQHALALEANESIRHEYKVEIDSLRLKHSEELKKQTENFDEEFHRLNQNYEQKISELEKKFIKESNVSQICFEECYKKLQLETDLKIEHMKQKQLNEIQNFEDNIRQKIVSSDKEIEELNHIIITNEKNIDELSNNLYNLQEQNHEKELSINELRIKLQDAEHDNEEMKSLHARNVSNLNNEIEKLTKDKVNFSVTLETTRQTVNVLGSRLRNSDEHVERLKIQLEDSVSLNTSQESQISLLKKEYDNFKSEYNNILLTIVESKSILDDKHKKILQENAALIESLNALEADVWKSINVLKEELYNDIDKFKKSSQEIINDYEFKLVKEHNDYMSMKFQCDIAYEKIEECQQLLSSAESQIESKDQELNEISTENVRLSGTLVALEQEKNELKTLSVEFLNLLSEKDKKINNLLKSIDNHEEIHIEKDDSITKLTQLLEATEFIVLEKDKEISLHKNEISELSNKTSEYLEKLEKSQLNNKIVKEKCDTLEKNIGELNSNAAKHLEKDREIDKLIKKLQDAEKHYASCDTEFFQKRCNSLENELDEITSKYTDLLGHKNTKQKIRHVEDLKIQNKTLKEENEKLFFTIEKQNFTIEKLKKKMPESVKVQSPLSHKKPFCISTNSGKENIADISQSPSRLGSPQPNSNRALTPLKDCNR